MLLDADTVSIITWQRSTQSLWRSPVGWSAAAYTAWPRTIACNMGRKDERVRLLLWPKTCINLLQLIKTCKVQIKINQLRLLENNTSSKCDFKHLGRRSRIKMKLFALESWMSPWSPILQTEGKIRKRVKGWGLTVDRSPQWQSSYLATRQTL